MAACIQSNAPAGASSSTFFFMFVILKPVFVKAAKLKTQRKEEEKEGLIVVRFKKWSYYFDNPFYLLVVLSVGADTSRQEKTAYNKPISL